MEIIRDLFAWDNPYEGTVLSLGVFDGVHIGHRKVLDLTLAWARELNVPAGVLTFDRMPARVLQKSAPGLLISLDHRLALLGQCGFDFAAVLTFTKELADTGPADFAADVLRSRLRAKGLVVGYDQRFGRNREGDKDVLETLGRGLGFEVRSAPPVRLAGQVVSSTLIRKAIEAGRLTEASLMLGRPVSCRGTARAQKQLGRRIGHPTFWLDLHHEVRPPCGVYAARSISEKHSGPALCNIAKKRRSEHSEFSDRIERAVELCFETNVESLEGEETEVFFLRLLRPELDLSDDARFREQLREDFRHLRAAFS
ncbi:MAG: riboflavin kinase [Planctomycetota bacterium]